MSTTPNLADALSALPRYRGLCWRGFPREITTPVPLDSVLPTTRDVRLATGNLAGNGAIVIVSATGRDVAPLSAFPQDEEIVFLPGTTLIPLGPRHIVGGIPLQVIGESVSASDLVVPTDNVLEEAIRHAESRGPVTLDRAGRFGWHPEAKD